MRMIPVFAKSAVAWTILWLLALILLAFLPVDRPGLDVRMDAQRMASDKAIVVRQDL